MSEVVQKNPFSFFFDTPSLLLETNPFLRLYMHQYRAITADHKLFFPLHSSAFFPLFMSFINIHQTNTIIHFKIKTK